MSSAAPRPPRIKVVLNGDGSVGKTCLVQVYAGCGFPHEYVPTVGADYATVVQSVDSRSFEVEANEVQGQEDYDSLRPKVYPGTDVFLVCFSVGSTRSLTHVEEKWFPELHKHAPGVPIILVGLKADLRKDTESLVKPEDAQRVANAIGATYHECSSMQGDVQPLFEAAVRATHKFRKPAKKCAVQ